MTTQSLVAALEDLGSALSFPETPDFDIVAGLPDRMPLARRRRWVPIAASVAAVVALIVAVPPARQAVADLLGIGPVRITVVNDLPETTAFKADLGTEVDLEDAVDRAPFTVLSPEGEHPDAVFVRGDDLVMVSQLFGAPTEPRLIVTQIGGAVGRPAIEKAIPSDGHIEAVQVGSSPGLWAPSVHTVSLFTSEGGQTLDPPRLAGNTLIYERDGVTIRIEADVDLPTALEIADSLVPVD